MAAERNVLSRKLVLLGDTAVGKSCLVVRFVRDEFYDYQEPTIGASFLQQSITLDYATIKFEIWDTAGQERYRSLAPMYYRGAAAAVVVFDVTNKETFEGAKTWVTELKRRGDSGVVIALAGNKCDLPTRSVDSEEAGEYAKSQGILYMEVSAKTNKNIKELFVSIANALPRNTAADKSDLVDMMATDDKKKKGCC